MPDIGLLANMNVSPETVKILAAQGWDTIRVSEVLSTNAPDEEIIAWARQERVCALYINAADLGEHVS